MQYPASISSEELSQLESVDFDGPIVVVSDLDEDFAEAMDYLKGQTVIGFDTETKPSFLTQTSCRLAPAFRQGQGLCVQTQSHGPAGTSGLSSL